jgi:predicted alpha/beta superfamily hydrolase
LPPEYDESKREYPVIYMQDAQNLFDVETSAFGAIWDVATIMDVLYNSGKSQGIIVVGIDNGRELRYAEYSPWKDIKIQDIMPHVRVTKRPGGQGFLYIDFIVNTLKPFIDSNFRTLKDRENTAISGSSMGGIISLVAAIKYQGVFSKVAAFSSALFFGESDMLKFVNETGKKEKMKIYMDVGTKETSNSSIAEFSEIYINSNKRVYEALRKSGFGEDEIKFRIAEGAIHNENEWSKRFPSMLNWMFDIS